MRTNRSLVALLLSATSLTALAQTPLVIPPTLSGTTFDLELAPGTHEFMAGMPTNTIGYNGNILGPTLIMQANDSVQLNVMNMLGDTTTTHWHGLHISPQNDGSPHTPILDGQTWSPSFKVRDKAGSYWYHPHLHGKTMEQVIAGASGMIIVQDAEEAALTLPRNYGVDDIPLILQFKTIDASGQLLLEDELDDHVVVNGSILPTAQLPAQVVRLRLLNGSSHRSFRLGHTMMGGSFKQIASDGGLLNAPVTLTRMNLSPGERAEILIDLSGMEGMSFDIRSFGSELPTGVMGGAQMMGMATGPLDDTDFTLMSVNVVAPTPNPVTTMPTALTTNTPLLEASATATRTWSLQETPMMSNEWFINGLKYDMERIDFTTTVGATEIWEIQNASMMGHPFHIHGGQFYVLDKAGAAPPMNERGRKDVILVEPMQTVRVIMRYDLFSDPMVPYMFHCHILSHEDNGMMGQFIVDASSDVMELGGMSGVTLFPNPLTNGGSAQIQSTNGPIQRLRVVDMTGREVLNETPLAVKAAISTERLAAGTYTVLVETERGVASGKLVVE